MRLCAAAVLVATAGLSMQTVWAAELGTLSVSSRLNEPLAAKLTVNDVTEASQPLVLRLASDAVYSRVGRTPLPADLGLKLTLANRSPWVVNVTSVKPVTMNDMPLIIEMSEAGKLSAKFYRVKLEPAERTAAVAATPTTRPTTAVAKTKYLALPSAQSSAKPVATLPSAQTTATVKPAPKMTVADAGKTTKKATATSDDLYNLEDLTKPVTVKHGMTMWSIAKLYQPRYKDATPEEVLVGFVRSNPKAFSGAKVTGVKLGSRLRPPSEALVQSIGRDTAWCLVHVTPNADAIKMPSRASLAKARARLDKMGVAYAKLSPAKATPKVEEPAPLPPLAPMMPPPPVEEPVAPPPVAEVVKEEPPQEKAEEPKLTVATTSNIRTEELPKAEDEGGWGWLLGVLVFLGVGAGGWLFWRRKKNAEFEETARAVRFTHPVPTTDEQMKGVADTVKNRLAADAAARRGFPVKDQTLVASKEVTAASFSSMSSVQEERSKTVARSISEASPAGTLAAATATTTTSVAPATEVSAPTSAHEEMTSTLMDFSLAAESAHATVGSESEVKPFTLKSTAEGTTFELAGEDDPSLGNQKLETARQRIREGFPDDAARLLREVSLTGTSEQKTSAIRLLDAIKRV